MRIRRNPQSMLQIGDRSPRPSFPVASMLTDCNSTGVAEWTRLGRIERPKLSGGRRRLLASTMEGTLAAASFLETLKLVHFSRPRSDRLLYRLIRRHKMRRIVELGLGDGTRALRMIAVAQRFAEGGPVQYTGVDLFEMRPPGTRPLALKQAYRMLADGGARIRLFPGDPAAALASMAGTLPQVDLAVISGDVDAQSLEGTWRYLWRMLHPGSLVFQESQHGPQGASLEPISLADIQDWATALPQRHRRAA